MIRWWPLLLVGCPPPEETEEDPCEDGEICVIMGSGELGFNGDGPALETRLAAPTSVAVDPDGRPMVVDYSNMRLRVLTEDGQVETIVGNGFHAYSEIGVDALETPLENPVDALWHPDGRLYILPQHEGRVILVEPDGTIGRCAGTGALGDSGDGGDALDAEMGYGNGLAVAPDGSLFVADQSYSRVRWVRPDGTIDTILGVGQAGQTTLGLGPDTAINSPERMVVDDDRLLVADMRNHRVLAVDLETLQVTLVAGNGAAGSGGDGGAATEAQIDEPVGLAVDELGRIWISDLESNAIRRIEDGIIETVAGSGVYDDRHSQANALDFSLHRPAGLAWDGDDLLIAERSGHRVLRWKGAMNAP